MQLALSSPPDLRDPGDPTASKRHLALLVAGAEPSRAIGIEAARLLGDPGPPARGPGQPDDRAAAAASERLAADVRRMRELGARYWLADGTPLAARLGGFAPRLLFVRGLLDLSTPAVAIVGTRHPDEYGADIARRIAAAVARSGAVVVSGGASGVDAIAHEAALDAGGRTIAVLGGGLAKPHPAACRPLFERMVTAGSCIVSEYPPSMPALRHHFPERNRLVAALADAVVVVQAGAVSGALITAEWARRTGRPLFAVPADVWYERSAGCTALLRDGAARIFASPADLASVPALSGLAEAPWPERGHRLWGLPAPWIGERGPPPGMEGLPWSGAASAAEPDIEPHRDAPPSPLIEALGGGVLGPDELATVTGLPAGRVQAELLALEVAGRVRRLPGGGYIALGQGCRREGG